jgi:DNA repair/transcription protein MET18/MMS19
VKALVQIGLFIHGSNESEKSMSYMDIVVQKIVSMISSDNHDIPFQLQLEAISDIGTSGLQYMLKIVTGLQEVIRANLAEVYVRMFNNL